LHLIHAGVGSAALVTLPWSLIPLFLVPFYLIGHGIVFAQARSQARSERPGGVVAARGKTATAIG